MKYSQNDWDENEIENRLFLEWFLWEWKIMATVELAYHLNTLWMREKKNYFVLDFSVWAKIIDWIALNTTLAQWLWCNEFF